MKTLISLFFVGCLLHISMSQICAQSHFFDGQRCAPCQANCKCTVEDQCDSCLDGYAFDATFKNCLQCPQATDAINIGCSQCCFQIANTEFVCSSCASGAYNFLKGGQCLHLPGCSNLDESGRC